VNADRLLDIYAIMERHERDGVDGVALCAVAAEFTVLDGAGIALISDGNQLTSLCTSNPSASALMNLELTVGEGPTVDASRGDATLDNDLVASTSQNWTVYRAEAVALGAKAVFGYPVRLGGARFGALSLYRNSPGPLNAGQSSDAYLMASVIGRAVLSREAGASLVGLASEMSGDSLLDFRVHQAAGMLAIQASTSVKDALVLLRARAFGVGSPLSSIAQRVITGLTRFDSSTQMWFDKPAIEIHER
jgi:hypothetical protein